MIDGLQIIQYDDGRYGLTIMEPGAPDATYWQVFEDNDLEGGGYTWEGLIDSLVRLRMPDAMSSIEIGAEADNAYVNSAGRNILERIAALIEEAINEEKLLTEAIENADDLE
jgi:hypothetical protein